MNEALSTKVKRWCWKVDSIDRIFVDGDVFKITLRASIKTNSTPSKEKKFLTRGFQKKSNRWRESMKNTFLIDFHLMNSWWRSSCCLYWDLEQDGERWTIKVEEETDRQTDRERERKKDRRTSLLIDPDGRNSWVCLVQQRTWSNQR